MPVVIDRKAGEATFIFAGCPQAKEVYLAGQFNQWNPRKRMSKYRDGTFRTKVSLPPGEYQYKFVADGVWVSDPEAERQVVDPFGGVNSEVHI